MSSTLENLNESKQEKYFTAKNISKQSNKAVGIKLMSEYPYIPAKHLDTYNWIYIFHDPKKIYILRLFKCKKDIQWWNASYQVVAIQNFGKPANK